MKAKILMAIGIVWCIFILWNMAIGFSFVQLFWMGLGIGVAYKGYRIGKTKPKKGGEQ